MRDPDDFEKATRYDTSKQRYNRAVFAAWLRARPVAAVALSVIFVALGIGVLLAPNPQAHAVWIVATLALIAAVSVLTVAFRRGRDK